MGVNSKISWTRNTWNPWMGCTKVAPECAHCYIDRMISMKTNPDTGEKRKPWGEIFRTSEDNWKEPVRWEKKAAKRGKSVRVFTCSESDFFHPDADEWRPKAWEIIKNTPHLLYQILTKRPGRIASHLPSDWGDGYENVWLGVTAGTNESMVQIDKLREVIARRRFVSAEPLLEDVSQKINLKGIDWLIAGGESGDDPEYVWITGTHFSKEPDGRRTMNLEWAKNLQAACKAAGTVFYFKQVTAARSGQKPDALGETYHDYPDGPFPWYTDAEFAADFLPKKGLEEVDDQREGNVMSALLEPIRADEPEIISGLPETLSNEDLAVFVRDGIKKFSKLVPYVRELRQRFADLPRGHANIMGCATWTEFCEKVLGRTDRAVRKALEEKPPKTFSWMEQKTFLFRALKFASANDDSTIVHFSNSESGNVLVRAKRILYKHGFLWKSECDLEVPAPRPTVLGLPESEVPDDLTPFGFALSAGRLIERIEDKRISGDPTITLETHDGAIKIEQGDGQLRFRYEITTHMLEQWRAEKKRAAQRAAEEALPYQGDFIPDLKAGDGVAIEATDSMGKAGEGLYVMPVLEVTKRKIIVSHETPQGTDDWDFSREGYRWNLRILRIATDEDRLRATEWREELKRRAETRRAEQQEKIRQRDAVRNRAESLWASIPTDYATGISVDNDDRIDFRLKRLSVEQFERIVEALQPILGTREVESQAEQEEAPAEESA